MSRDSYEQIADVYDCDMGQSMSFDDIAFYRAHCQQANGPVLELGCGTGRILLPLLAAGVAIEGIDQSPKMLAELTQKATAQGLHARTREATLLNFANGQRYARILAPYSVLTYLTDTVSLQSCFAQIADALLPNGECILDSFIPKDIRPFDEFRLDYRRAFAGGTLKREKRIARQGLCNRIERRYTVLDAAEKELRQWHTFDVIRPWHEVELLTVAAHAGLRLLARADDFSIEPKPSAQFFALRLGRVNDH